MNTPPKRRSVLGDFTSRLENEFRAVDEGTAVLPVPITRGRSAPGHLLELTGVSQELQNATKELDELRKQKASGFEVELTDLRVSPYQAGGIVRERVQALVENLRVNLLSTPITVRETAAPGIYEIVAGHHRAEAYRELGRTRIPAVLRQITNDEAERVVFYDNLLAPSLSDFEKYLGFAQRKNSLGLNNAQLAAEAGVEPSVVSRLMAVERLPAAAQELIRAHPRTPGLGSTLFGALAALEAKYSERVVEAVKLVIDGKLAGTAAANWVTAVPRTQEPAEATVIKRGKKPFAKVRARGAQWTVNFASEDDARVYAAKLLAVLQEKPPQE